MMPVGGARARAVDASARRALDIVGALVGLIVLAPLMALIALAIRLDTPGPVLFSHLRLGRGGSHFRLYKFRKFRDAPAMGGRSVTLRDDERFTRVGRILERSKLDELPQFWNVLIGDMSLVGPRPETLNFADCFDGPFRGVLDHRPGIFGPNQVIFRSESSLYPADIDPNEFYRAVLFPKKAKNDLWCFAQRSLFSDLTWIARGIFAVFGFALPDRQSALDRVIPLVGGDGAYPAALSGTKPSPSSDAVSVTKESGDARRLYAGTGDGLDEPGDAAGGRGARPVCRCTWR